MGALGYKYTLINSEKSALASEDIIIQLYNDSNRSDGLKEFLKPGEYTQLENIEIRGTWAIAEEHIISDTPVPPAGNIVLFKYENGAWQVSFRGSENYKTWLEEIPQTLLPEDLKNWLR